MVAAEPSRTARPVAREASSAITNGAGRTGRRTRVRAHVFPAPGGKRAPGRAQPRMRGRGLNLGSAEAAALETRRRPDVRDERLPAAPAYVPWPFRSCMSFYRELRRKRVLS